MVTIPLVSLLLFGLGIFLAYFFLSGFIWGAGYYPTPKKEIDHIAKLLNLKEGSTFYDLGSGFGGMIISMAERYNVSCVGVEIDPLKCWWSNMAIRSKKLSRRVSILQENLLDADLQNAERIFIFLSPETRIMARLQEKIFAESKPGTRIVSYVHRFQGWKAEQSLGELHLYCVPDSAERHQSTSFNV